MIKDSDLPTLNSLLAFEATIRHRSMTAAAKELEITQPLVSQRIRALEDILGGILVDRSTKPLTTTEAGSKFYHEMQNPLLSMLNATASAKASLRTNSTKISICGYFGFAFHWLMPRLQRLQEAFPDYHFDIQPTNSLTELLTSKADILFHFSDHIGKYKFEEFLIAEEVFPVCSPSFAAKLGLKKGDLLTDLRQLPLLHKDKEDPRWLNWQSWSEALGIKPSNFPVMFCYNNYPLVVEAAISGQGMCLGWEGLINPFIEEGKLIELGPRLKSKTRGYQICSDYYSTFAVGNVIKWLINEVKQEQEKR
jgi:DNA-binding transcriptional LysR family regulator